MRWVHAYMGERVISRLGGRRDWRPAVAVSSDAWEGGSDEVQGEEDEALL